MSSSDEMPNLADLRRSTSRRRVRPPGSKSLPSLFDPPLESLSSQQDITPKDIIREVSGGLASSVLTVHEEQTPAVIEPSPAARVWRVSDLVREVRGLVERNYTHITIDGEISNWRPSASGHCYFTLKDGNAQLAIVMFRKQASLLRFSPKDGDAVRLRGQVSVYENRGQMQLIAESMEEVGQGALLAEVQRLKERLRAEGLFDRKRPLPAYPKCIGIVTSLQGAALRDIVKVCRRRHAAVNLLVYPAAVQGPRCAPEIVAGLQWFSAHRDKADVVIVARGGGSWEDLHGFDEENVVRAIAACSLPVIAGIGHASDSTIADLAADVCAPTPSAAAEIVTSVQHQVEERLARLQALVFRAGSYELLRAKQRVSRVGAESALRRWRESLARREQFLDELGFRVHSSSEKHLYRRKKQLNQAIARLVQRDVTLRIANNGHRLERMSFRLQSSRFRFFELRRGVIDSYASRLNALSPLRVLDRGYALIYTPDGKLLRSVDNVVAYDTITARLANGSLRARVLDKDKPQG